VEPAKLKDVPIWGTVFEGRLFPILKKTTAGIGQPDGQSMPALAALPLPSCFAPGEAGHEDGCGACGFNRLLAHSGVLHTMVPARELKARSGMRAASPSPAAAQSGNCRIPQRPKASVSTGW